MITHSRILPRQIPVIGAASTLPPNVVEGSASQVLRKWSTLISGLSASDPTNPKSMNDAATKRLDAFPQHV
jgi:hypothetical protein